MVICPDCGKEVKDAKFCSNCGSPLPENVEEVAEEFTDEPVETNIVNSTKFCSNCGTELDAN